VLDEPTNDLDVETLDLLQELLDDYDGTVLLVSHDRDFLDRVATTTIAMEGDGRARSMPAAGGLPGPAGEMAAKPGEAESRSPPPKPANREAGRRRRGLSFTEKHRLEALAGRDRPAEAEIAKLEAFLADSARTPTRGLPTR
jgi:ATP-binding cassette subfamily F protein uup